ncbi:hypothetical protein NOV72_01028 [Caballeronia novacaledonica]|uniref:Uncharacterized protein n=1 Tax=Caballeronia novacaledonica TaxID=1544861 RepID=A0A2U3I121_9BURK|nr:hypothetical protein [Caballeronia novacaledonica]SPB13764.1 hypothetical protein NOV72_01028 [Caballeronia novacaledonica]
MNRIPSAVYTQEFRDDGTAIHEPQPRLKALGEITALRANFFL